MAKLKRGPSYKKSWITGMEVVKQDIKVNMLAAKGRVVTQRRSGRAIIKAAKVGSSMNVPGKLYEVKAYPFGDFKEHGHKLVTNM